jgi:hypothetical protein
MLARARRELQTRAGKKIPRGFTFRLHGLDEGERRAHQRRHATGSSSPYTQICAPTHIGGVVVWNEEHHFHRGDDSLSLLREHTFVLAVAGDEAALAAAVGERVPARHVAARTARVSARLVPDMLARRCDAADWVESDVGAHVCRSADTGA